MFRRICVLLVLLFAYNNVFAQEAKLSHGGLGLETSMGVISGNIPQNYSLSLQSMYDGGASRSWWGGWSLDWIHNKSSDTQIAENDGILFDLYLSLPVNSMFRPYLGGGIGIGASNHKAYFAWKTAAGTTIWFSNKLWYLTTGISYDNVRKDMGVAIGVGLKLNKTVQGTYRSQNGSTFERTFDKYIWQDNNTPDSFYTDEFAYSEVVDRYQKTTNESVFQASAANLGIESRRGHIGPNNSGEMKTTTYYYVWDVTVTRNWYTRTYYYKDRAPSTEKFYKDKESAVLVDQHLQTETR